MGKKGFSRKAFLKPTKGPEDDEQEESQPSGTAPPPPSGTANTTDAEHSVESASAGADPSSKFLVSSEVAEEKTEASNGASSQVQHSGPSSINVNFVVEASESETRGQMLQRHKKEAKALKETAKKMGKKRKDEAEQLEKAMEARHAKEVEQWEQANPDPDAEKDKTVLSTTSGLYDLKIGADEESNAKKPTKAQKRREQRAAEEAEREARIAEEQAQAGPSEREVEAAQLCEVLKPSGLALVEIPADGNCMYRALEDQLRASGEADEHDHQQLREEAASYIRAFPEDFYPFIYKEESAESQEQQLEAYCSEIEETSKWGGQIELQALSQALEKQILVYSVGMPVVDLGQEYKGKAEPLRVCYLRHAFGLGEHYNSTKQISTQTQL